MRAWEVRGWLAALAVLLLLVRGADAADVELAPFAGVQFGGSFDSPSYASRFSIGSGLAYGATANVAVAPGWRVELLYSRQETALSSPRVGARFDLNVERYMAGIQEEKGSARARFFGVFLMGLTRFAPAFSGYGADERFTLGLSLGLKTFLSSRFGLRLESRGFLVPVGSGGGALCANGSCAFRYSASGLWQADLSAAAVVAF